MTGVFPELYTKGSRIWIKHTENVWQSVTIKVNYNQKDKSLIVEDEDEQEINLPIGEVSSLPPLRNPDILIGVNDLTSLSYLHEPAVLYNLRVRFLDQSAIYTWCGIVLVAINPFCDLEIYGEETIQTYHKSQGSAQLDPHIYAVSEDAYSKLERDNYNQSVIVSGESGAGKTVSAKFAMRYFASIAGSESSNIENRVLASNPIMEAIGNAKTNRNDNSSRFGKYIQILFDAQSRAIVGGNMRTYLLEKSRVSRQSEGERNFHIFYQMCTFAQKNNLNHLKLKSETVFEYLGQIEPTEYDDMTRFVDAMQCLGFSDKQQNLIYSVIAAILHAGNIDFAQIDDEKCCISQSSEHHLQIFCQLLGLDSTATKQWLTHRVLKTGMREIITTSLTSELALYGRDGLLKFVYEKMFSWIVGLINKALGPTIASQSYQFIGVLDIYGFEHFEINSFEQFCINYANEVLQQQFNQHVFKLEQEDYIREGIDWQFITFTDNQPVIDIIEAKPIGILGLLDEECKMPKGTDETWCAKLYAQLTLGEVFQKPKFGNRNSFIIQHFADMVVYNVEGFLEKNRDTIWDEQIDLLKRSTVIDSLFIEDFSSEPSQKTGGKVKITPQQQQQRQQKQAKATVGSQFRDSLAALMRTLNATEPHYVRCIKPNDNKGAFEFNNIRAVQQLRACGVLETIRISSNGFPSRWSYQDFANRYRVLRIGAHRTLSKSKTENSQKSGSAPKAAPRKLVRAGSSTSNEIRTLCEDIVKIVYEEKIFSQLKLPEEQQKQQQQQLYQFGKTKIFFRSGQVALLERIRSQKLRECAILLQRMVRGWIVRRRYVKIRFAIMRLQCYGRAFIARKLFLHLKHTKAATIIQTKWRSWSARQKFLKLKKCAIGLQRFGRGLIARRKYMNMRRNLASITIQRYWRGFMARKEYQQNRRRVIIVQSLIRRFLAKRQLKRLKIEARSVEHVTNLNKGLERKIIELQQKIDEINSERKALIQNDNEINDFKKEITKLEIELKNVRNELKQKDIEFESIQEEMRESKNTNEKLSEDVKKHKKLLIELKSNNAKIRDEIDPKLIEEAVLEREKILINKFDKEKKALIDERETERASRQQLLRKYMALEEKLQSGGRGEDEEDRSPDMSTVSLMMRCSELEQECAKFKHENQEMRELIASTSDFNTSDTGASLLAQQCAQMQVDLDRYREERTNLKTIVLSQESNFRDSSGESELISAFKAIVKQLETELDEYKEREQQLRNEIISLKNDNNRQQQLIGINSATLIANGEEDMITRFQQENTLLREKCDKLLNENKQLRMDLMRRKILDNGNEDDIETPTPDSQNVDFVGMFEYKQQNESLILRILINDLEPTIALKFQPHLPAYIIYMCIRYTDYNNDDVMVRSFLNNTIMSIKRTIKRNTNVEIFVLWLSNTCKLITCLKQYSGEEMFGVFDESLKNFDLSEYRQIFSDIAIWVHQGVIKQCEERIQSMIVPAILEYEGLASSGMYSQTSIQRSGSITDADNLSPSPTEKPIDSLIKELSYLNRILLLHVIEGDIIHQIFKQLFYFICASSLNNLLLRKDLCHWNKAMQIRFNLSSLEQWCREHQIPKWNEIVEKLDPIIQATKLLQTRKAEEHIPTIVEMCNKLSSSQIIKILNLYTAGDEEMISNTFIKKVQQHLTEQRKTEGQNTTLLMDTKYAFAFTIPYIPSDVKLQSITLPPVLVKKGLATVLKKL